MQTAMQILVNTPIWVFALLAFLAWQGGQALRPTTRPIWRVLIVPAVFLLMGLSRLVLGGKAASLVLIWFAAAAVFLTVALIRGAGAIDVDEQGNVVRPGSVVPLVRNLTVFLLQYAVAVVAAMKLDAFAGVAIAGQAVSGACSGYFLGWGIALVRAWRAKSAGLATDRPISL
ncbi:MAG: hypothetical protein HXX15_03490 [Rhodopseudomonas sp.]|uniref:hypothetical protein n=1 Tax=Rhodopseudomonas sp. TaxID=1078 RepID=UPI0017B4A6C0|nr:hypothetical protein [Rhodopseudomonas sp.]NVN85132.1 hypothetical protein [Rhodopseudomonas sp.]